jgi:hypothetical protein
MTLPSRGALTNAETRGPHGKYRRRLRPWRRRELAKLLSGQLSWSAEFRCLLSRVWSEYSAEPQVPINTEFTSVRRLPVLKAHGIEPATERKRQPTWKTFLRAHWDVRGAIDFTTVEVWTKGGLVTFYLLFVMEIASRRVCFAGCTPSPDELWMPCQALRSHLSQRRLAINALAGEIE